MKKTKPILLLISVLILKIVHAQSTNQNGALKGSVIDANTLQPIAFANVYIKDIQKGSTTDEKGNYLIENIPVGKYNITFSFIGYDEKTVTEVEIKNGKITFLEVQLNENVLSLENITISVHKYEENRSMPTGTYSLSREEIYRSPASNGNIFKAISVIPGVQSGGGSFSALAVRGQGAEENATYVDGFPVFDLSHLAGGAGSGISGGFDDPNGGRFSIFGPRVINGLVIQTGGFSALYGRKSSSYLGLTVKSGNPENPEIDALFSLTGALLNYSGPFINKNPLFVSLRYQNFVPALNLTNQGELGDPSLLDFTLKNEININGTHKITIITLINPEWFVRKPKHVLKDKNLENVVLANVNNNKGLIGIKWRALIDEKSHLVNWIYTRFKKTKVTFGKAYPVFNANGSSNTSNPLNYNDKKGRLNNYENELGLRSIYSYRFNKKTKIKSGIELSYDDINHNRILYEKDTIYSFYRDELPITQQNQNYATILPENFNSDFNNSAFNFSFFSNIQFVPVKKMVANIGIRYDYTGFSNAGKISPRLSLSYKLNEKSSFNAATGIFYQDPLFIQISDNSALTLKAEKATHYIMGYKHYFTKDLKLTIEGYYKNLENLIVRPNSFQNILTNQGKGYAYGVDISLVKRLSNKYNGIISYSYSQSKRNNHDGKGEYNHLYSQPHIFNFLLSYQPDKHWILSGKFRYSTGQPTNKSVIYENIFNNSGFLRYGQELIGRNQIRNDDFIGIDLRVDRKFQQKKYAFKMYLDIQNVLNRTNAATRVFFETTGNYRPEALGILPTVGIQFEF